MDAQIGWVRGLGSPSKPGSYAFRGVSVQVKQADIDRASAELAKVSEVIFNAVMSEPIGGDRRYILGSIA